MCRCQSAFFRPPRSFRPRTIETFVFTKDDWSMTRPAVAPRMSCDSRIWRHNAIQMLKAVGVNHTVHMNETVSQHIYAATHGGNTTSP
ncbi:hypothetical protein LSAT2_030947 [Lamellibrachia satsuma]|nr:hypothetical protein LSAT2_030947 [Lamellibrachia satsuma]